MRPHTTRSTTTAILLLLTGLIFLAELTSEFRLATWLPYFLLAILVSQLYSRRIFRFAVGGWSLLIAAGFLAPLSSDNVTTDLSDRTIGMVGLWITAYLLDQQRAFGGQQSEHGHRMPTSGGVHEVLRPLVLVPERSPEQKLASQPPQSVLPIISSEPKSRILLVDDSLESHTLMRFYFRNTPYDLEIASDGEQAVAAFQTGRFDLVLIDLHMPGMDGFTATRTMRAWESSHKRTPTPIVAMTANTFTETQEQSLAVGCTEFLPKPITKAQLFSTLRRYRISSSATDTTPTQTGKSPDTTARVDDEIRRHRPAFLDNRRKDLSRMQDALAQEDYEAIRTTGHRMKGLAGSYGFSDIGAVGERLELAARSRDLAAIRQEIDQLATILAGVNEAA